MWSKIVSIKVKTTFNAEDETLEMKSVCHNRIFEAMIC